MYYLRLFNWKTVNLYSELVPFSSVSNLKLSFDLRNNGLGRMSGLFLGGSLSKLFHVDRSRVPVLVEDDLDESFVRGSGPGGSNVNKNANCVVLKHKPTGFVVKCHESRLLAKNRTIAREKMITKLDNHLNGDLSVESQIRARDLQAKSKRDAKARRHRLLKEQWKLNNTDPN